MERAGAGRSAFAIRPGLSETAARSAEPRVSVPMKGPAQQWAAGTDGLLHAVLEVAEVGG